MLSLSFNHVKTQDELKQMCEILEKQQSFALDLECENNLHHYGAYISLIQISTTKDNWIVDVLQLKGEIKPLIKIFENKNIQKVLHDINFDLRILSNEFNCKMRNFFDTQIAALFTGRENIGLGSLLEEFFQIKKERKFQKVDWTRRPLTNEQLSYAVKDSFYLLELKEKLIQELKKKKRLGWVEQELDYQEEQDWSLHRQTYLDISGVKNMTPEERSIFHALFDEREKLAKEVDKPVFKVFANKQLLSFAKNPPYKVESWKKLKGVHPLVKSRAEHFFNIVKQAMQNPEELERKRKPKLQMDEKLKFKAITEIRNEIADRIELRRHLLLKEDQIISIVKNKNFNDLRQWQKDLLQQNKEIKEMLK